LEKIKIRLAAGKYIKIPMLIQLIGKLNQFSEKPLLKKYNKQVPVTIKASNGLVCVLKVKTL
jgi:hypothetical protein